MEPLSIFAVLLLLVLGVASFLWLRIPIVRVMPTRGVGYVKEILFLGFWVPVGSLSDRLNKLAHKEAKLTKELKKTKKLLEDERKRLDAEVAVLDDKYRTHLYDWNGKRYWRYLFRRVPVPTISFVAPVEEARKPVQKRSTMYTLDEFALILGAEFRRIGDDRFQKIWPWSIKRNTANQQQSGKQKNRGGNNANQQQQKQAS